MVGLSNTNSNDKLLKEADSLKKESTGSTVKGIDSMKVERAVFKDKCGSQSI